MRTIDPADPKLQSGTDSPLMKQPSLRDARRCALIEQPRREGPHVASPERVPAKGSPWHLIESQRSQTRMPAGVLTSWGSGVASTVTKPMVAGGDIEHDSAELSIAPRPFK